MTLSNPQDPLGLQTVYVDISFLVQGHVKQTIQLSDPAFSVEAMIFGLKNGTIFTTIQDGGFVEFVADGRIIGRVVNVDNECEYSGFEACGGKYRTEVVGNGPGIRVYPVE